VQYTDATFTARVLPDPRLGILGPVLRGMTGEYIEVTFLNRAWLPLSMHPHGVRYDKENEGSYYKPNPGHGAAVAPGARFTYVWQIDEAAGPRPDEPSSKAWLYHSHVTGDGEANLGLIGFIVVTDPARARADGTPNDVDREMGVLFKIFDEGAAADDADEEPDERVASAPTGPVQRTWAELHQLAEEGERHTLNGLTYGNLPGLEMNEGERVRWYLFGLGSENDFHTAHWHGLRAIGSGSAHSDVVELLPGSMKIADTLADTPGDWLLHCHVADHMEHGMFAKITVYAAQKPRASNDVENRFFGLPKSLQTLRVFTAEYTPAKGNSAGGPAETYFDAQVTVADPYIVSKNLITVSMNGHSITFAPDASGISSKPEGVLLVKNVSPYGNGNVLGGTLRFEVTLKGDAWVKKVPGMTRVEIQVGSAHHEAHVRLAPLPPAN